MSESDDEMRAIWLMNLFFVWILKDAGLVTTQQLQERLRQTKEMLVSRFGVGPKGLALIEEAMDFVTNKTGETSEVVPLRAPPAAPPLRLVEESKPTEPE